MKKALFIGILLVGCAMPGASVLSSTVATMQNRTFVKMPANASLDALSMGYSLFYYADGGCWDPVRKMVRWVGAGGTCCSDGQYYMVTYAELTDTWAITQAPFKGSGHAYDGNGVDPATGDHYFVYGNVHKWNGSWSTLPNLPYSTGIALAGAFFPEINGGNGGMVHIGGGSTLAWYNGTSWTRITGAESAPWGSYHTFGEYNPVHKVVWLGGGNGGTNIHYLLNDRLQLTKMKNAPIHLRITNSLCSVDPVSGNFIVQNLDNQTWWEFNPLSDVWTQLTGLAGAPTTNMSFHAPLTEHGAILYFRHGGREVYLYKHASSNDTLAAITVSPDTITIEQNETAQFTSRATNTTGRAMAETIDWSVSGGGSISPAGLFSSNGTVGTFTVTATGTSNNSISGTAKVTVIVPIPDTLSSLVVTPDSVIIGLNGTAQFAAQGKNQFGEDMTAAVTWSVDAGGDISSGGLFTADGTVGVFKVTATAVSDNSITATASVEVIEIVSSVLVDFGATAGSDVFGTTGWSTLLKDSYTNNVNKGPGGMTITNSNNGGYNYQGVSGTSRSFAEGDKIVVTWYNDSSVAVTFTPKISFDDPDRRVSGTSGTWYDMTPVTIQPGESAATEYVFTSSTAGSHSLVNVNCNFSNRGSLICDKIEHYVDAAVDARALPDGPVAVMATPNPFKSRVFITVGKKFQVSSCKLSIFNINGKQVKTFNLQLSTSNSLTWDASGLPSGLYLLKVSVGNRVFTKKLLLNK